MSTTDWLLGLFTTLLSPWMLWPVTVFVVWALFAVRIDRRHYLNLDDLLPEESEEK